METLGCEPLAESETSEGPCLRPPSPGFHRPAAPAFQGLSWLVEGGFPNLGRTAAGGGAEPRRRKIRPTPLGKNARPFLVSLWVAKAF